MKATLLLLAAISPAFSADIRLGIIGTDTSHVPALAKLLNDPRSDGHVPGARIVAAYKGGSKDLDVSINRVENFATEIHTKYGVELVADIPTLLSKVDGVLLTSVDGRVHLEQARQVIAAHKPLFIDKPLATTLEDAREIARLAKEAHVPWFSSSSLRYGSIAAAAKFPDTQGATTWGPGPFQPHHYLDLSWYGIHALELLYTIMGPGCQTVTRSSSPGADVVVGLWKDGRIGTVRALRPSRGYGAVVFRSKEVAESHSSSTTDAERTLTVEIVKFFEAGRPPVPNEETLEIFAFLDAAQRSKEQDGRPVSLR
jgi:predicted dehydrogenase